MAVPQRLHLIVDDFARLEDSLEFSGDRILLRRLDILGDCTDSLHTVRPNLRALVGSHEIEELLGDVDMLGLGADHPSVIRGIGHIIVLWLIGRRVHEHPEVAAWIIAANRSDRKAAHNIHCSFALREVLEGTIVIDILCIAVRIRAKLVHALQKVFVAWNIRELLLS